MIWRRLGQKTKLWSLVLTLLLLFGLYMMGQYLIGQLLPKPPQLAPKSSNYALHRQQNFNQADFYPILTNDLQEDYKPVADWVGRLILPTKPQLADGLDWVWMQVEHAPPSGEYLLGKKVRLQWQNQPDLKAYMQAVSRDINFTPEAIASQNKGNIHPFRLNHLQKVGVLRSLAGANPDDSTIVALNAKTLIKNTNASNIKNQSNNQINNSINNQLNNSINNQSNFQINNQSNLQTEDIPILEIDSEPILITGRLYSLVKIIKPITPQLNLNSRQNSRKISLFKQKPFRDYFLVKHYNPVSRQFDGREEIIRIPQQIIDTRKFAPSSPKQIEKSPAGEQGWYIYGAYDINNTFVARSLAPYTLFSISPQQTIVGEELGLNYIRKLNWRNTPAQKGKLNTVLILPEKYRLSNQLWQEGDKAILLHLFGGIGGEKAESLGVVETITGHFAFGTAEVVRDEFTEQLRFELKYNQIYAHNSDGIISGTHTWANYMGNLQYGWLSTRPVSDIIIKFDPVTQDYDFDGVKLSPLEEFQKQLQIAIARYRTGDGTGGATVSPATSCVQDSNQALYATILVIKNQVAANPQIQTWLQTHPDDPQTLRFAKLVELGQSLEQQLAPLGIVRADWQSQASILAGTGSGESTTFKDGSIWAGLTTWRTMMPRQAHDDLAKIFLKNGAIMQFLRTNQVGGRQPEIQPLAPTILFGQIQVPFTDIPLLPILLNRVLASLLIPTWKDCLIIAIALTIFSLIALPVGFRYHFLHFHIWSANWLNKLLLGLRCLLFPALFEELVFRVLFLPHPVEVINWWEWGLWGICSLFLFIIYHPFNAKFFVPSAYSTFSNRIFLTLAGLLGITCTITYGLTGSLWTIIFIHWLTVTVWLIFLGGVKKLSLAKSSKSQNSATP